MPLPAHEDQGLNLQFGPFPGLDDFIASLMICGRCNNGLQLGRTGGQSCEPLEEKIGGEVTTARQFEFEALSERFGVYPFHGGLLSVLDLDPQ